MTVSAILLGFLACAATSLAFGIATVRALRLESNRLECLCLGYVIGSALVSAATFGIVALWIARKGIFLSLSAAALPLLWYQLQWLRSRKKAQLDSIPLFIGILFGCSWLVFGLLYFRFALSPEWSPDGMVYHLGVVNLWNHAHGLIRTTDMFAAMPEGMEMLYLFAFAIGRNSAAALVHFSFLMLLPLLMILYGIRFGIPRGAAAFAAILVFATPLVGWDGSVAYNDVSLATTVLAAVYLLGMWRGNRSAGCLVASALLAGFAFAIKYTGGFASLFVVATVLWELRREAWPKLAKMVLLACAAAAMLPLPYLIRNCIWFHDPIAFFGNSIFPNPYFHVSFEHSFIADNAHINGVRWRDLPLNLTIGGSKLPQSLGPIYLLAPIALAGLYWPQSRFLVIAALAAGCGYPGNKSARFLIPALPLLSLALGFVLSRLPRGSAVMGCIAAANLVFCWPAMVSRMHFQQPDLANASWSAALRRAPEEQFLTAAAPSYLMARQIESHVPEGQTVFALTGGEVAQAYTTRFILDSFHSASAERAVDLFYMNASSPKWGARRWTVMFPETKVRTLEIVQNAGNPADMWSIDEIRVWHGKERLRRSAAWLPDASPNPWDIGFAFDGKRRHVGGRGSRCEKACR